MSEMTQFSETYCLAILVTNLKRRKRYPDPITVADCAKYLFDAYSSIERVAQMVGVHPSVIRKWVGLACAPSILRQYVREGKIYPVAAFAILSAFSDENMRVEITKEVAGWGEPEIVRFIRYMKNNPNLSPSECKNMVMAEALQKLITDDSAQTRGEEG
jgi:hypothetical protein